tara:strand:- start:1819 stop:1983 length:165 start_codon:yes stop_codon:yes gene_type:complete
MENKKFLSFEEWFDATFPNQVQKKQFAEVFNDDTNVAELLASVNIKEIIKRIED